MNNKTTYYRTKLDEIAKYRGKVKTELEMKKAELEDIDRQIGELMDKLCIAETEQETFNSYLKVAIA